MSTLVINKAYRAGSPLMESHIDAFRTGLLDLINTNKLSNKNFSTGMSITSAKFSDSQLIAADNSYIYIGTSNNAWYGIDASKNWTIAVDAPTTVIQMTTGTMTNNLGVTVTNTVPSLQLEDDKAKLVGTIMSASNPGFGIKSVLGHSVSKPVLEWYSATAITIKNNFGSLGVIGYFPTFVSYTSDAATTSSKFRYADITSTANGYGTAHTGAALGGRRVGLTLTTNSWYYVYYCKVRSGTDYSATAGKAILVYDSFAPTASNESILDSNYGAGCWLYVGCIRYGFGATGSASTIIKFMYSKKGLCLLYGKDSGFAGLNLAYSTADTDDTTTPLYTVSQAISGNAIPPQFGSILVNVQRDNVSDWYVQDGVNKIIWRGGWQSDDTSLSHGHTIDLPNKSGLDFCQVRKGTGAVAKGVALIGFTDTYLQCRRTGRG